MASRPTVALGSVLILVLHSACTSAERPQPASAVTATSIAPEQAPSPGVCEGLEPADTLSAIESVRPTIRTTCWQPALDISPKNAPTTARVEAKLRVDPDGYVTDIQTTAPPYAYPKLSDCIEGILKEMRFPACRRATTVLVPFIFDARK